ncbi:MAG TPA: sigma-70 family RNA polymerase sigma factor [Acidimicrobiales bacterium]|nr:sigma-70 family RNA polymerase sigma factor [Acidimicrobiales bacterium]
MTFALVGRRTRCGTDRGESDLIAGALSGDEDAWEELYRRVYPRLFAYLAKRLGRSEAEDAVNETMTRAVAGLSRYRPGPAGFDGWLFGIARHVSLDHQRRSARRPRHAPALVPDPPVDGELGDGLELAADHLQVRRAYEALGPADREVLDLRVVAGLSVEQTAAALGRRPGAVRTAQSRALARLRTLMEHVDD